MGKGFKHGGGDIVGNADNLGINVITYSYEDDLPEAVDENTIAVCTTDPITVCNFHRGIPSFGFTTSSNPTGELWIATGKYSPVYFDIENENISVRIYPIGVYQAYLPSGDKSWTKKDARIYQNGEWKTFDTYIYDVGDTCNSITGGWKEVIGNTNSSVSFSSGDKYLHLGCKDTSKDGYVSVYTINPIDFSEYTQIAVCFQSLTHYGESGIKIGISSTPYKNTSFSGIDSSFETFEEYKGAMTNRTIKTFDLTAIHNKYKYDGEEKKYHVQLAVQRSSATIYKIYLCGDRYFGPISDIVDGIPEVVNE
jgi:hypothetical protein